MAKTCVYAGSFDPVTVGHEDIIRRAAKLCDKLYVTVMYNPAKQGCFTVAQRLEMLARVCSDIPHAEVDAWSGLMVDYVRKMGADFVVRGVRGSADLESESNLAQINARLLPGLETVLLISKPEINCVSSTAVREAALFDADFSSFVPACIYPDVKAHFNEKK
nr:pantetheine-phosphate adenylyltransferase [Clostridia bacterium]